MKSQQSITPAVLKLCAAAVLGLGAVATTGVSAAPAASVAAIGDQTDRLIVKYKDEAAPTSIKANAANAAQVKAAPLASARKALLDTVGQKHGTRMQELH